MDKRNEIHDVKTIDVTRPTGPRVLPPLAGESRGYLAKHGPHHTIGRVKSGVVVVASVLRRPKAIAVGSSLALAIVAHLAVSGMTHGFSSLMSQASLLLTGVGPEQPPVASGYTGPLDVISPAFLITSVRCAGTSYTGNVMDVWDASTGSTTNTLITCSSGGVLNTGSPSALATTCASGCKVKTWYDQSGQNKCTGGTVPCDFTNATNATRPALLNFATPASWKVSFTNGASTTLQSPAISALSVPYPVTTVLAKTGSFTSFNYFMKEANGNVLLSSGGGTNTMLFQAGTNAFFTASDSVVHSLQFNAVNGTGTVVVDGTATTPALTAASLATVALILGNNAGAQFGDFDSQEFALYPTGAWNSTQYLSICHNQRLYFGTSGSC